MATASIPLPESSFSPHEDLEPQLPWMFPFQSAPVKDLDAIFATSSDPPLFSSDDLPAASADNYAQPRRKRQHRRTWYEDDENASKRRRSSRGKFSRNFDSGIWMGSDESIESGQDDPTDGLKVRFSSEDPLELVEAKERKVVVLSIKKGPQWEDVLRAKALRTTDDPEDFKGPIWPYWQKQPTDLRQAHMLQQGIAQDVGNLVALGQDTIDFSNRNLSELRSSTLRPLHSIINTHNLHPNTYITFSPRLELYLSSNTLTSIPAEIYHLKYLRVLSLRSNAITDIAPAISRLTNLEELNVGCNSIRYLPFELLSLYKSARDQGRFNFFPNPFMRPFPSVARKFARAASPLLRGDGRRLSLAAINWPHGNCRFEPYMVAATPIAYLDIAGSSLPNSPPAPSQQETYTLPTTTPPTPPHLKGTTPSLLELTLRTALPSPNLSQTPFLLPEGPHSHLSHLLQRTWHLSQSGGQKCTICKAPFIIPRTEWLEWWRVSAPEQWSGETVSETSYYVRRRGKNGVGGGENGSGGGGNGSGGGQPKGGGLERGREREDEEVVPFLKRGCGWGCVPGMEGKVVRGWK